MARQSLRTRVMRAAISLAVGGSAFQLSGCDTLVRSTLLDGLEATTSALTDALISAFFLSLEDGSGNLTST